MSQSAQQVMAVSGEAVGLLLDTGHLRYAGYSGWLVVEAEQDPAVAHPATYARLGFDYLRRAVTADASDA